MRAIRMVLLAVMTLFAASGFTASGAAAAGPVTLEDAAFSAAFSAKLEDDFGVREGAALQRTLNAQLTRALARVDATPMAGAELRIVTTIEDAKPNRPTFQQLGDRPGLSLFGSVSVGGARLRAEILDQNGVVLAVVEDDWYDSDIRDVIGAGTWQSAGRAMTLFARKVADAYAALPVKG